MRPHNLKEYAESLIVSPDCQKADWGKEILDLLEGADRLEFLEGVAETVRYHAERPDDVEGREDRAAEWLNDRHNLLADLEDVLEKNGYAGLADDALAKVLDDLEEARADASLTIADYDL